MKFQAVQQSEIKKFSSPFFLYYPHFDPFPALRKCSVKWIVMFSFIKLALLDSWNLVKQHHNYEGKTQYLIRITGIFTMRVTSLVFVSFSLYSDHSFRLILGMELNHQRLIQKLTRVYDIADKQGVQGRFSSYVHVCHFCYSGCPGNPLFPTCHTCIFLPFFTSLCSSSYHMRVLIGSYT